MVICSLEVGQPLYALIPEHLTATVRVNLLVDFSKNNWGEIIQAPAPICDGQPLFMLS